MIIKALYDYYVRRAAEPETDIPLDGFSLEPVPCCLEINPDGSLHQFLDERVERGGKTKKLVARRLVLPQRQKTSGQGFSASFLWDNTGYVLGADTKEKPERIPRARAAFRARLDEVAGGVDDAGLDAVRRFLDAWNPAEAPGLPNWDDMAGANVVFRLAGDRCYVHERPALRDAWLAYHGGKEAGMAGQCLVTGEIGPVDRVHPQIMGVKGAQTTGASLVSFNPPSFESYGREQCYVAPISSPVAFGYTTGLKDLLRADKAQKVQIGDATTIFWTEEKTASESMWGTILNPEESKGVQKDMHLFLSALRNGVMPPEIEAEENIRMYLLGLAPNAARLAVRFWHVDTVGSFGLHVGQHYADMQIVKQWEKDQDFPPLWLLLAKLAHEEDLKNISPLLAGALTRSIITGAAYPRPLLALALNRVKAKREVGTIRAGLLKAVLNRNARIAGQNSEVTVSLNEQETNVGYRLGRLFAVLEKAQQDAIPGANSTIRDRFFGSAMTTPRAVFPTLLKSGQHHISKVAHGVVHLRRVNDILDGMPQTSFPAHLSLDDQGRFTIGYHHQQTALWAKKADDNGNKNNTTTEKE